MATNETKAKWTPGPWRVDYQCRDDSGDERLAVFSFAFDDETPGVCAGTKTWPLTEGDADLIAAAPDLYEALAAIVEEYAGISDAWSRRARAALARAEGL
jgi:hypothetical protein